MITFTKLLQTTTVSKWRPLPEASKIKGHRKVSTLCVPLISYLYQIIRYWWRNPHVIYSLNSVTWAQHFSTTYLGLLCLFHGNWVFLSLCEYQNTKCLRKCYLIASQDRTSSTTKKKRSVLYLAISLVHEMTCFQIKRFFLV